MKIKHLLVSVAASVVLVSSACAQTVEARATCKLTNTAEDKSLYEGSCKVKQMMSDDHTIFSVKMGDASPFLFAGIRGEENWMHGSERVKFTDLPNGGIFRWSTFALVVAE